MSDVLEMAEKLGKAIHESPQAKALREIRAEMDKQEGTQKLLEEFQKQMEKIAKQEQEKKPVEVDDKHKLEELQSKLLSDETFKKFTAAQVDYVDLMRQVNQKMRQQLTATEVGPSNPPSAGGVAEV